MMREIDERVILSVNGQKNELSLNDFVTTFDKEIKNRKTENIADDIRVVSTNGKEKIYIDYDSNQKKVINKKNDKEDIWQSNPFINRRQKLAFNNESLKSKQVNEVTATPEITLKPFEHLHIDRLEKDTSDDIDENLKQKLAKIAIDKLNEMNLGYEDQLSRSTKYFHEILCPLFKHLKNELVTYNRQAYIHDNFNMLTIDLEVRYRDRLEFDYIVQIKNPHKAPVLEIKTSNVGRGLILRKNLSDISINKISQEALFHDFLISYKKHLYSSLPD